MLTDWNAISDPSLFFLLARNKNGPHLEACPAASMHEGRAIAATDLFKTAISYTKKLAGKYLNSPYTDARPEADRGRS